MSMMSNLTDKILILTVLLVLLPVETVAFGAGDIPDFAYLNDKAFRHGDIENILEEVAKTAGGVALGGGIMNIASSVMHQVTGGSKFSKSDIKKIYFGNWLRDYSQAMDIAGLSKLTADTLVLVVAVLGFMTFGFSTQEFEVTPDRLGVYLPVEHIDNPKGYAEKEGDPRKFHPKLRPPVRSQELEIDERTGMKKYMATENQGWDTSTAFIRRTLRSCIESGRRARGNEGPDLWEAYRLMGTGLHTLEDLLAHSNWCEIALRKMGYKEVFCHVGDNVTINTPNGRAPPLVTGTFGSADFLHSLLGEAGDKLSQASVTDLSAKLNDPSQGGKKPDLSVLQGIFKKFGGGDSQKLDQGQEMKQQSQAYQFNPNNMAPPVVKERLLQILKWHDDVLRDIIKKIEMVPGLSRLLDEFSDNLNEYIYTIIAPYIGPILTATIGALNESSKAVIDNDDQFQVFNNPNAHDPSHSLLSKDHFGLILNEPAGKIARVVVQYSVNLIVRAWSDNSNPDDAINRILEVFHHPYYANGRSEIQNKMLDEMQKWVRELGGESREVIQSLTKDSVKNHRNKRKGLDDTPESGYGCGHGTPSSNTKVSETVTTGYGSNAGSSNNQSQYGQSEGYGRTGGSQRRNDDFNNYGGRRTDDDNQKYGDKSSYGREQANVQAPGDYMRRRNDDTGPAASYGYDRQRRDDAPSHNTGHGGQRLDESYSYISKNTGSGGQRRDEAIAYGGSNTGYGSQLRADIGRQDESGGYGSNRYPDSTPVPQKRDNKYEQRHRDDDVSSGFGYSRGTEQSYGRRDDSGAYEDGGNVGYRQGQGQRPIVSGYAPSYGQPGTLSSQSQGQYGRPQDERRGGTGDGQKYGRNREDDDNEARQHRHSGQGRDNDNYGSARRDRDDSDDDRKQGKHDKHRQGDDRKQGPTVTHSSYDPSSSSYAPSYSGNADTYGVERLNIGDDQGSGKKKHNKHHEGGYGY